VSVRWILVVEDEALLGELLVDNLRHEGYGTELIRDGRKALERIREGGIDLVLLDLMLPGLDGLKILETLRGEGNRIPVLVLSARSRDLDRVKGLALGADDYLGKPFNLRELLLRIQALLRRSLEVEALEPVHRIEFGGNRIDLDSFEAVSFTGERFQLTRKEAHLLRYLAGKPHKVISRKELLDNIWGMDAVPTPRTIDNFIARFRKLFERDPRQPAHFHTLRGVGYRFEP